MRAIALGVAGGRVKTWTDPKTAIVRAGLEAGEECEAIRDRLRAQGFERGRTSIYKLARSMGISRADRPWRAEDDARLRDLYGRKGAVRDIAAVMARTVAAIASRASVLGLKQRNRWCDTQRARLRRGAEAGETLAAVAADLGRPVPQVRNEARRLSLPFPAARPARTRPASQAVSDKQMVAGRLLDGVEHNGMPEVRA